MTDFIVLRKKGTEWDELPGVHAGATPRKAVESAISAMPEFKSGEFRVTPARSWHTVKVEAETALKFS